MNDILLIVVVLLSILSIILVLILTKRKSGDSLTKIEDNFAALEKKQEQTEHTIKDEITRNRQETAGSARQARGNSANP